ncbi:hypothetical protein AB0J25_07640, partial [Streptomyces sp. NPDC049910]
SGDLEGALERLPDRPRRPARPGRQPTPTKRINRLLDTPAFEQIMLLAGDDVVEAAHELNAVALQVDRQANGKVAGTLEEWRERNRAVFRAIAAFQESARVDLGVDGSVSGEQPPREGPPAALRASRGRRAGVLTPRPLRRRGRLVGAAPVVSSGRPWSTCGQTSMREAPSR